MKNRTAGELMVDIKEYATVFEEATLYEAVRELGIAQKRFAEKNTDNIHPHRAVLVMKGRKVVGKISQGDALAAMGPKKVKNSAVHGFGMDAFGDKNFCELSLEDVMKKARNIKVKDVMYAPTKGEFVDKKQTLGKCIDLLKKHHSLLVRENGCVVGVLRLTDVFVCTFEEILADIE